MSSCWISAVCTDLDFVRVICSFVLSCLSSGSGAALAHGPADGRLQASSCDQPDLGNTHDAMVNLAG